MNRKKIQYYLIPDSCFKGIFITPTQYIQSVIRHNETEIYLINSKVISSFARVKSIKNSKIETFHLSSDSMRIENFPSISKKHDRLSFLVAYLFFFVFVLLENSEVLGESIKKVYYRI